MYYLPIYVNNRRMHVLKLTRAAENQTLFTFLVDASGHYDVFSFPSKSLQLICDNGENVDLRKVDAVLERVDSNNLHNSYRHCDGVPVYNVKISKGSGSWKVDEKLGTYFNFYGNIGDSISKEETPFTLKALYQLSSLKEYIIQFTYECDDVYGSESTYVGAIRICEYKDQSEIFKASLDFGSEASQIHLSTSKSDLNMNIRDAFVNLVGEDINKDYWQGRKNESRTLYKSIYHIHKEPGRTEFGDMPMNNGKNTFLQSLLGISESTENYILLPNLKLVEQLSVIINQDTIRFKNGGFMGDGDVETDLSNKELNDGILRLILCNFLAVTMNSEKQRKYLHFILLVPNVYGQEKVHKLIAGLYDDFNLLRQNEKFSGYKGIEVSIVSESDASFFGVRAKVSGATLPWGRGAHYLIIDAGKGTTDFSLLSQKGRDLSSYSSIYRSGIPASGHVLTYAFYDAVRSYFYSLELGSMFDNIIRSSVGKEISEVLNFVSILEQFKIKFSRLKEEDYSMDKEAKELEFDGNNRLYNLNAFLTNVLKNNKLIPGMTAAIDEKVDVMTNLLKESIVGYIKKQKIICKNVILTGRAFMLDKFKDVVSEMLVKEGVVKSKDDIFYKDEIAKSICTYGAMIVGEQSVVNKNSNMLGSPILKEEFGENLKNNWVERIKTKCREIRGVDKGVSADISFDFFYEGLTLANARNAVFSLSGVDTLIGTEDKDNMHVYYVGDGYIWKKGNRSGVIQSNGILSGLSSDIRKRLVKESIFPFNVASMGLGEEHRKYESLCKRINNQEVTNIQYPKIPGFKIDTENDDDIIK